MRRLLALSAATAALGALALAPSVGDAAAAYELNVGSLAPDNTPWRDMLPALPALCP